MRYLSLLILLVTFTGCQYHELVQVLDTSDISQDILHYGAKLKYEKHLHLEDSVVYYNDFGTIEKVRLDFSIQSVVETLWASRELLVDTVEGFLDLVNNNDEIVPYLPHNELTPDNLEVYIVFTSYWGKFADLQDSALATLRGGNAYYFTFTAFDCSQDCWQQKKEYYWQSKMFVEFNREGEEMYAPKPNPLDSVFGVERFIPTSK